jgi:hypothetical protein
MPTKQQSKRNHLQAMQAGVCRVITPKQIFPETARRPRQIRSLSEQILKRFFCGYGSPRNIRGGPRDCSCHIRRVARGNGIGHVLCPFTVFVVRRRRDAPARCGSGADAD